MPETRNPDSVARRPAAAALVLLALALGGCAYFGGDEQAAPPPVSDSLAPETEAMAQNGEDAGTAAADAAGAEETQTGAIGEDAAETATGTGAEADAQGAEASADGSVAEAIAAVESEALSLKETAPLRYVVKRGDTLWDIASFYLRDAWQWPELWYVNPQVENPHLIYPGDELMLITVDGRPRVVREVAEAPAPEPAPPAVEGRVQPQARAMDLAQAVPTIPLDAIRAFLRGPRLVDKDELDEAPYVLDFEDEHLVAGADTVAYVLNLEDRTHTQYQIVRLGQQYRDPDDGDVIGYEALPVAEAEVRVFGEPATIYIPRSDVETRIGDHLLPVDEEALLANYLPRAPEQRVEGRIIAVYDGNTMIGQYQVVALNRGSDHGLAPGHVLTIWQAGRKAKDPYSFFGSRVELPDVRAGTLMVFKVRERLSYALVLDALRTIAILDKVEKPEVTP